MTLTHRNASRNTNAVQIDRAEWIWLIVVSAFTLLLSSLPYIAGYLYQSERWIFYGSVFGRPDFAHHLGGIWLGMRGEWAFRLLYTGDPHPGGYLKQFYITLGHLGRVLNLSPLVSFHLARVVCGSALLVTVYRFAARCFRSTALRRTMFLFFALGSGLGWLQLMLGWVPQADISPIDFWHFDSYGFFSLVTFPHLTLVYTLLVFTAVHTLEGLQNPRWSRLLAPGAALLALQLIQPFSPAIIDAALIGYLALTWFQVRRINLRQGLYLAALGLLQMPLLIYQLQFINSHPVWQSFMQQNITLSPPPVYYLAGYGIMLPLAIWGGWLSLTRGQERYARLAVAWVVTSFALAYAPLSFQRRFTEGVMLPLSLLAATGSVHGLLPWMRRVVQASGVPVYGECWRRTRRQTLALLIAFTSLSSLYIAFGGALYAAEQSTALFDSHAAVQAVDWLGENSDWREPVLGAERTGSLIVARIGHTVYAGHPVETTNYTGKLGNLAMFFDDGSDDERCALLSECGCSYVFYGPHERALGSWDPFGSDFLDPVFRNAGVVIFRVSDGLLNEPG